MNKEVLIYTYEEGGIPGVLSLLLLSAFSEPQRKSIRNERDGGECHFPAAHECNEEKLEVHHIEPQRWSEWHGKNPDHAENALTVCTNAHDLIHPDRVKAKRNYHSEKRRGRDSFRTLGQERDEKLRNREKYWVDRWDSLMAAVARRLTQDAAKRGWRFPSR